MEVKYNVTGAERKQLVTAISEILDWPTKYLGAPSFAYEVDYFTVTREGNLTFNDMADSDEIERILAALEQRGFSYESAEYDEPPHYDDDDSLVIEIPRDGITDAALENLQRLVASKADLIKKALGAQDLPIELTEDTLRFPWFDGFPDGEVVRAYAHLVGKLVGMAKSQNRINAQQKPVDNEKYAFRCFLLRLGFIGAEYKEARKILLRNLSGSSAFKGGVSDE